MSLKPICKFFVKDKVIITLSILDKLKSFSIICKSFLINFIKSLELIKPSLSLSIIWNISLSLK